MIGFILRRLAQLLPVLLIASTGTWAMIYAVPGDPVAVIVGENALTRSYSGDAFAGPDLGPPIVKQPHAGNVPTTERGILADHPWPGLVHRTSALASLMAEPQRLAMLSHCQPEADPDAGA